jgi:glycosyltransferase involved in cell wall biosynthesis
MRILAFSSCFPSARDPIRGVFVLRRLSALARLAEVEVVHPVEWFPLYRPHAHRPDVGEERLGGLTVNHKRFFYIPGILKRFDGRFYALGLERWTRARCEAQRPDLLDAQFEWPDAVGVSILARRLGLPYTVTLRGTINPRYQIRHFRRRLAESLRHASRWEQRAALWVHRRAARLWVQAESFVNSLEQEYRRRGMQTGWERILPKLRVVGNGLELLPPAPYAPPPPRYLFVGRLVWEKDLEDDFHALKPGYAWSTSPSVEGELLLLSANSRGLALNKLNGNLVWAVDDVRQESSGDPDKDGVASVVVADIQGKRVALFSLATVARSVAASGVSVHAAWKASA